MVVLVTSPLYHVNGFAFASPAMLEGGHVVIMEKFDAAQAVELIEKHQIKFTVMVPTMLQRVAASGHPARAAREPGANRVRRRPRP